MTDGDVVGADLRRHVEVSQGKLGRIERRIEIEVIHAHEETQVGVAGESAGKARVVVSGGWERADAAARQVEDSVAVAVESKFAPQVGLICCPEAAGEIVLIEVDRGGHGAAKAPTTAAPAAGRWRRKATHPGIRVGESTVLVAQEFGVK